MKVGIVGFARSGKTTILNALTGAHAPVGAFGSRAANIATIKVPDERIDRLVAIYNPKKTAYADIEFVDVAPNETGGEQKALDGAALNLLKNVDALVHVVRAFEDASAPHPLGGVDPVRDIPALDEELLFSDLLIIEKRIDRLEREGNKGVEFDLLRRCRDHIESGTPLRSLELTAQEAAQIQGFTFLSQKPILILGNYGEPEIGKEDPCGLRAFAAAQGFEPIEFCGSIEMQLMELSEEEQREFREDLGLGEESRTRFIHAAYDMLGLISFLTVGDPEVHAWTIKEGATAVEAAGAIHSDIQRGFIRAEVVAYHDFIEAGSMVKAKEHGKVRLEGKDYLVHDGDIILFRFNI